MFASVLAKCLLSVAAGVQSFTPMLLDVRSIRVSPPNPQMDASLRFSSNSIAQAVAGFAEVALLWWPGPDLILRFYIVAVLTAISVLAGFVTLVRSERFGEGPYEPGRYFRVPFRRKSTQFDIDIFLLPISVTLLVAAVFLF